MKLQLKLAILIFWNKFAQNFISSRKSKSEHHHGILHNWCSLGTKFQLELVILSFWTKFTQKKRYFQSKTEQAVQGLQLLPFCVVNLSSILLFLNIFKISKVSLFWTFWKKNWLCLASWALFILKLCGLKSLYNFTGLLKKLKLVMVMVKIYLHHKYHHLFNLQIYYFIFSWLRLKHTKYKGTLT